MTASRPCPAGACSPGAARAFSRLALETALQVNVAEPVQRLGIRLDPQSGGRPSSSRSAKILDDVRAGARG